MFRVLLILSWLICSSIVHPDRAKACFGVRVSIGANSEICTYACWLDNGRVLNNKRLFDKASFIKIISGEWPSIYNPDRINFFEENGLDCGVAFDSTLWKEASVCHPLDSLWKIRFGTYPFKHNTEMGWSNKYHKPSPKQEKYLYDRYNVTHVDTDFFLDTNFWRLLNDVRDTSWIKHYRSLH